MIAQIVLASPFAFGLIALGGLMLSARSVARADASRERAHDTREDRRQ